MKVQEAFGRQDARPMKLIEIEEVVNPEMNRGFGRRRSEKLLRRCRVITQDSNASKIALGTGSDFGGSSLK